MTNDIQQTKEAIAALRVTDGWLDRVGYATVGMRLESLKALAADHTRLASEIERLREALEHYADEKTWIPITPLAKIRDWYWNKNLKLHGYDIAQAALQPPIQGDEV